MMIWYLEDLTTEQAGATSFIVRADTEAEAREYAASHPAHGEQRWRDPARSSCAPASDEVLEELMLAEGPNGVVLHG